MGSWNSWVGVDRYRREFWWESVHLLETIIIPRSSNLTRVQKDKNDQSTTTLTGKKSNRSIVYMESDVEVGWRGVARSPGFRTYASRPAQLASGKGPCSCACPSSRHRRAQWTISWAHSYASPAQLPADCRWIEREQMLRVEMPHGRFAPVSDWFKIDLKLFDSITVQSTEFNQPVQGWPYSNHRPWPFSPFFLSF